MRRAEQQEEEEVDIFCSQSLPLWKICYFLEIKFCERSLLRVLFSQSSGHKLPWVPNCWMKNWLTDWLTD